MYWLGIRISLFNLIEASNAQYGFLSISLPIATRSASSFPIIELASSGSPNFPTAITGTFKAYLIFRASGTWYAACVPGFPEDPIGPSPPELTWNISTPAFLYSLENRILSLIP